MKCQPVLFYAAMLASLRAGSRQKASDVNLTGRVDIWPNNRRPEFVRLGYERVVGNIDPFPTQAHTVMTWFLGESLALRISWSVNFVSTTYVAMVVLPVVSQPAPLYVTYKSALQTQPFTLI